ADRGFTVAQAAPRSARRGMPGRLVCGDTHLPDPGDRRRGAYLSMITEPSSPGILPLAGFAVGITAARRADELGALLVRKGATVRYGPAIRIVPLADDTELHAATTKLLDDPVDVVVATTGTGFRGWVEA